MEDSTTRGENHSHPLSLLESSQNLVWPIGVELQGGRSLLEVHDRVRLSCPYAILGSSFYIFFKFNFLYVSFFYSVSCPESPNREMDDVSI